VQEGLSVRQVESLVRKILENEKEETAEEPQGLTVNYLEELEKQLSARLGRKIKIVNGRKRGRLELEFYGQDDLNRLSEILLRM
ncbi:stage 0 sporulation protein J, partial [Oscillospiraceae bacterium OttesenSCG-928-G22]|nr:stage 0 sporulation protein J [Oscillospiraceae bacterium OttesenSCG-928-G22]